MKCAEGKGFRPQLARSVSHTHTDGGERRKERERKDGIRNVKRYKRGNKTRKAVLKLLHVRKNLENSSWRM